MADRYSFAAPWKTAISPILDILPWMWTHGFVSSTAARPTDSTTYASIATALQRQPSSQPTW